MSELFDAVDVIHTKRDGGVLSQGQIDWVIDAYVRGVVVEEQMSALAMAILLRGMNREEISRWTSAMIASGERMDFSTLDTPYPFTLALPQARTEQLLEARARRMGAKCS